MTWGGAGERARAIDWKGIREYILFHCCFIHNPDKRCAPRCFVCVSLDTKISASITNNRFSLLLLLPYPYDVIVLLLIYMNMLFSIVNIECEVTPTERHPAFFKYSFIILSPKYVHKYIPQPSSPTPNYHRRQRGCVVVIGVCYTDCITQMPVYQSMAPQLLVL